MTPIVLESLTTHPISRVRLTTFAKGYGGPPKRYAKAEAGHYRNHGAVEAGQSATMRHYRETTNGSHASGSWSSAAWMADAIASRLLGGRQLTRLEAGRDRLQRMARGDLRLPPSVGELTDAPGSPPRAPAARSAFSSVEPRLVDRLERQLRLKSRLGRRVELAGRLERPRAGEVGPVAVETQQTRSPRALRRSLGRRFPFQRLAASGAERLRAFAFELAAREGNPLFRNDLAS